MWAPEGTANVDAGRSVKLEVIQASAQKRRVEKTAMLPPQNEAHTHMRIMHATQSTGMYAHIHRIKQSTTPRLCVR